MEWAPQVGITVSIGPDCRPVDVDWSLSLTGADDSPQQVLIRRAESAGIDFVKHKMQPELDAVEAAVMERLSRERST